MSKDGLISYSGTCEMRENMSSPGSTVFGLPLAAVVLSLMRDKISKKSTELEAQWALAIMDSCPNGRRIVKSD